MTVHSHRFTALDKIVRSTTLWLCPTSFAVFEIDSRICHAQGVHGDLSPSTDEEIRLIISDLRDGFYDDARDGIREYFDASVRIPAHCGIAAWTPRDGARLAHLDLLNICNDDLSRRIAADITVCREIYSSLSCIVMIDCCPFYHLEDLHKALADADDAALHMSIMSDIANGLRAAIYGIVERRPGTNDKLKMIMSDILAAQISLLEDFAQYHRAIASRPF